MPGRISDLSRRVAKLRKLLVHKDADHQRQGLELLCMIDDPETWDAILEGMEISDEHTLIGPFETLTSGLIGAFFSRPGADFEHLSCLNFRGCRALVWLDGLANCPNLSELDLSVCLSLKDVDGLADCAGLTQLNLSSCHSLVNVDGLAGCTHLTELNLGGCLSLVNVDGLAGCTHLGELEFNRCERLQSTSGLSGLTQLTYLDFTGCKSMKEVSAPPNSMHLYLIRCESLHDVSGLAHLSELQSLCLSYSDRVDLPPAIPVMLDRAAVQAYQTRIQEHYGV